MHLFNLHFDEIDIFCITLLHIYEKKKENRLSVARYYVSVPKYLVIITDNLD